MQTLNFFWIVFKLAVRFRLYGLEVSYFDYVRFFFSIVS